MDIRTHTHGQDTEIAAFHRASKTSHSMRARILRAIEESGGMTPDEFAEGWGGLINTVRRRFTDLWKDGFIKHGSETRKNASGNDCVVWVMGEDVNRYKNRSEMSQYIKGFDAGCTYTITQIETYIKRQGFEPRVINPLRTLLMHLKA
jgi:hypothetical protein